MTAKILDLSFGQVMSFAVAGISLGFDLVILVLIAPNDYHAFQANFYSFRSTANQALVLQILSYSL